MKKFIKIWTEGIGRKKTYHCSLIDEKLGSIGEVYVFLWLMELKDAGYIDKIELQPESLLMAEPVKRTIQKQLKTKTKLVSEHVASDLFYTADFMVKWTKKAYDDNLVIDFSSNIKKEPHHIFSDGMVSLIECKPDGLKAAKPFDGENMVRLFVTKQKMIYHELGIWVNLVFHNALFRDTFMPERYIYTDKATKVRDVKYKYVKLKEYIDKIKPEISNTLF